MPREEKFKWGDRVFMRTLEDQIYGTALDTNENYTRVLWDNPALNTNKAQANGANWFLTSTLSLDEAIPTQLFAARTPSFFQRGDRVMIANPKYDHFHGIGVVKDMAWSGGEEDWVIAVEWEGGGQTNHFPAQLQLADDRQRSLFGSVLKYAIALPAEYTDEDPYGVHHKKPVFDRMQVDWWNLPVAQQKQAIVNAFRATMLSPRMNLKSNAILYQLLMDVPADESDPDVFENKVRAIKKQWDAQGQTDMFGDTPDAMPQENILQGEKLLPGFWGNLRRLAALGPYAEDLRQIAITDLENGGRGNHFRENVLALGIPGVGPKVASFAWLALNPTQSDLATIDVWMMKHLEEEEESPRNPKHYYELEEKLRSEKNMLYGEDTPLGQYQWGVWDKIRSPGFHQDHAPLRVHEPVPYNEVDWQKGVRAPRPQRLPSLPEGQMAFAARGRINPHDRTWAVGDRVRVDPLVPSSVAGQYGTVTGLLGQNTDSLYIEWDDPELRRNQGGWSYPSVFFQLVEDAPSTLFSSWKLAQEEFQAEDIVEVIDLSPSYKSDWRRAMIGKKFMVLNQNGQFVAITPWKWKDETGVIADAHILYVNPENLVMAPMNEQKGLFYSRTAAPFDAPVVNPANYDYVPITEAEYKLAYEELDQKQWQYMRRRAQGINARARKLNKPGRVSPRELAAIYRRYQGRCAYDGGPGATSWDHVIPLSQGGDNTIDNLLPCHTDCNRNLNEWDKSLRDDSYWHGLKDGENPEMDRDPFEAKVASGDWLRWTLFNDGSVAKGKVPEHSGLTHRPHSDEVARGEWYETGEGGYITMALFGMVNAQDVIERIKGQIPEFSLVEAARWNTDKQGYDRFKIRTAGDLLRFPMRGRQFHRDKVGDIVTVVESDDDDLWYTVGTNTSHTFTMPMTQFQDFVRSGEWTPVHTNTKSSGTPDAGFEDWQCPECGESGREGIYEDPEGGFECRKCGMAVVSKVSMADRTGHPEIDKLIEDFLQTPQGEWTTDEQPIEALRNPELAHGMCEMVTEQFVDFAKERGFKAYVTQTDTEEMGYTPTGEGGEIGFNENEEMQYGFYPEHTIATIVIDDPDYHYGREFYIDFTASQYGYTDHPKVTSKVAAGPGDFMDFFDQTTKGDPSYKPHSAPEYDWDDPDHADFWDKYKGHSGNFDNHIETSIPGYRDMMTRKGVALAKMFGPEATVLDLMAGEGSWGKTVTQFGGPRSTNLDANKTMNEFFHQKSQVPGAELAPFSWREPYTYEDGTAYDKFDTDQRYDIVNESMGFQFISNQREADIAEAKRFLKPGGLFITDEKLITPNFAENEVEKDKFKEQYYTPEQLAQKQQIVNVQGEPATGMMANMVKQEDFEAMLRQQFADVRKYWESGNFVGYLASDNPETINTFLSHYTGPRTSSWKLASPQDALRAYDGERLQGYPGAVDVPGYGPLDFGAHSELQQFENDYKQQTGIPYETPRDYVRVDPTQAAAIAQEYEAAEHRPDDPEVAASYQALADETMAQYQHLVDNGYTFEFYGEDDPYPNSPREAVMDLYENKHMYVYPTEAGYGTEEQGIDHPLLAQTGLDWGGRPVTYNDLFRAVHDVFGHAKEGVGFRADGEENAWRQHSAMYSELARKALTAETRGQNSWVNFGPHGEQNQNANQAETIYAPQKATILPDWVTFGEQTAFAKVAMPYVDNTWYHVTDRSRLPMIAQQGLVGSEKGTTRTWDEYPVEQTAVYLWPNINLAWGYQDMLGTATQWAGQRLNDPVILRVTGIDRTKLAPDHEHMANYLEGLYERAEDGLADYGRASEQPILDWIEEYERGNPMENAGSGNDNYDHYRHFIAMLNAMPPEMREEIAKMNSELMGDPVMHYGPISPDKIEVGKIKVMDENYEFMDEFYDSNPEWAEEPDDADSDWYDRRDQAQDMWMNQNGPWAEEGDMETWNDLGIESPEDDTNTENFQWVPIQQAKLPTLAKVADYQGWTNWETWNTKAMIDNNGGNEWVHKSWELAELGVDALRDWTIINVLGPYNKQAIEDAQEWNDIPQHDRLDHNYEEFREKHPQVSDGIMDLLGGPDVGDTDPMIIDPELVNWEEITAHILGDIEEERRYEQGLPPSWEEPKPDPDAPGELTLPQGWSRVR